jgi:hypothetical protein
VAYYHHRHRKDIGNQYSPNWVSGGRDKPGQDILDRIAEKRLSGQVSFTSRPGQYREDRLARTKTGRLSNTAGARKPWQDSRVRAPCTSGNHNQENVARTV